MSEQPASQVTFKRPVKYIYSHSVCKLADRHPRVRNRASIVHDLIANFGLLEAENVTVVPIKVASEHDLKLFHSSDYIEMLSRFNDSSWVSERNPNEGEESDDENFDLDSLDSNELDLYGLVYDCSPFSKLWSYVRAIAGSTITAFVAVSKYMHQLDDSDEAQENNTQYYSGAPIVINWFGGWHHAHRDHAAGFCYVNDIVIGVLHLLAATTNLPKQQPRKHLTGDCQSDNVSAKESAGEALKEKKKRDVQVLYFDLDAHHGDAVQTAFYASAAVFTISVHRFSHGFYPGVTGSIEERGERAGSYASLNIPLKAGCTDAQFVRVCCAALREAHRSIEPRCIVLQCGADALSGDPSGAQFALTSEAYVHVLREILISLYPNVPVVILGGGGYVQANAARLWTALTSICISNRFDPDADVPIECAFAEQYAPLMSTRIELARVSNENSNDYIEKLVADITDHFERFRNLDCC